ncbi:uncharacterized protein LOC130130732 isoform X2 [Lampris incognitus]|uniref:uncharacterized protein LOC130130732 isoform X2 n=1 Tax=Lampris incognitus TaxID=2546036 RepID=UPI0024B63207|nr:uncharacterized protein LOC130130732 isoform X2 [Lampris incognitus]
MNALKADKHRVIMEDRSGTHPYPDGHQHQHHHHHQHHPSHHHSLPALQSPELGYTSTPPPLNILEQYGSRAERVSTHFQTYSVSSEKVMESNGAERGYANISANCLDVDASFSSHLNGEGHPDGHFAAMWYDGSTKDDVWDEGESCESAVDDFYRKDSCSDVGVSFHTRRCSGEKGADGVDSFDTVGSYARDKAGKNYGKYINIGYEGRGEMVYVNEANAGHYAKANALCNRGNGFDVCRSGSHSKMNDGYVGAEKDFSEDQALQDQTPAELKLWVDASSMSRCSEHSPGRWRGHGDRQTLASVYQPRRPSTGVDASTHTQRLDSFSKAFFPRCKAAFPMIHASDSIGHTWKFGAGKGEGSGTVKSNHAGGFESPSNAYLSPSSSTPPHISLPSLPSPPPPSHLMPSMLSPPPTPLPPPSLSPSKMDSSSGVFGGHSGPKGGESLGTLQFFTPCLSVLPPIPPSTMIWKFPTLSDCFPQQSGDCRSTADGTLRASHCSDIDNNTVHHTVLQTPDEAQLMSSPDHSSLHPSRVPCTSTSPSLHPHPTPSHLSSLHYKEGERLASNMMPHNGPVSQSHAASGSPTVICGTSFPSILHSTRHQTRGHYRPRPILNPLRRGTGLYSSLSSFSPGERGMTRGEELNEEYRVSPCINLGPDYQAGLPPCFSDWEKSGVRLQEEESPREQLLWKPWPQLKESASLQGRVERLLSMCSSSCLPGGGSNTELALHCLHYCQGDAMVALEMLLFTQPSPTGDYHYSGSDQWTDIERGLFSSGLVTFGKDFSLIQKTVKSKSVRQCVEFYYLSKKLQDKQKKQRQEDDRDGEMAQRTSASVPPVTEPINTQFQLDGVVPVPSLASVFPCKLCGKMFYKIKSRNAHMKIHRQPQEDWADRQLQHQMLTQRLALSLPHNLAPSLGTSLLQPQASTPAFSSPALTQVNNSHTGNVLNSFAVTSSNTAPRRTTSIPSHSAVVTNSNVHNPNPHAAASTDAGTPGTSQRGSPPVVPFHPSWSSFGLDSDHMTFYCDQEGKEALGVATGGKGPFHWQ